MYRPGQVYGWKVQNPFHIITFGNYMHGVETMPKPGAAVGSHVLGAVGRLVGVVGINAQISKRKFDQSSINHPFPCSSLTGTLFDF